MANGNKQRLSLVNILKIKNFLELFIFDFKSLRNRIPLHLCFDHIVLFIRFILKYITFLVYNFSIIMRNLEKCPECLQHFHVK
jgi:hypothetical protein